MLARGALDDAHRLGPVARGRQFPDVAANPLDPGSFQNRADIVQHGPADTLRPERRDRHG